MSAGEIGEFIAGLTSGAVTEGQAAAFAMAVYFRGMTLEERVALTRAMTQSGARLDWREADLPGPMLDNIRPAASGTTWLLRRPPMLAACAADVPMISGRGLGHTGGSSTSWTAISGYVLAAGPRRLQPRGEGGGLRDHRSDGPLRAGRPRSTPSATSRRLSNRSG